MVGRILKRRLIIKLGRWKGLSIILGAFLTTIYLSIVWTPLFETSIRIFGWLITVVLSFLFFVFVGAFLLGAATKSIRYKS